MNPFLISITIKFVLFVLYAVFSIKIIHKTLKSDTFKTAFLADDLVTIAFYLVGGSIIVSILIGAGIYFLDNLEKIILNL